MNDKILNEQIEILQASLYEIIGTKNRLVDYIQKHELYAHLTKNEAMFLNDIAIACQTFIDNNENKGVNNGNLGSK